MAIKFGDTLENQNAAYPIVDVDGNNIAGVHHVTTFSQAALEGVPVNTRRQGSIVIAKDTGKVYIYLASDTADGTGSNNLWKDHDGTAWALQSGDNTLGADSSFDNSALQTAGAALSSLSTTTTFTSAIDQLNDLLGLLVPTAPKSLATQINGAGEFAASSFGAFTAFNQNRLVSNPVTNSLPDLPSTGTSVDHTTDTAITSKTITIEPANDCAVEAATAILVGSVTLSTSLAAGDSSQTTSSLTLAKTTGDFPNTGGDSDGFYTGISTLAYSYSGTLGVGAHKVAIGDADSNPLTAKTFFVQPTSSPAAISAASATIDTSSMNEDTGFAYYYSSGIKHCGNTAFSFGISATVTNIVPSGVSVYGAVLDSPSDYNWAVGEAQSCFAAPPTLDYTAHQSVSSNTTVAAGLASYSLSQNVSLGASNGTFIIGSGAKPRYDFKSMYGNDNNVDFAGTTKVLVAWNSRASNSSTMVPYEEALYSDIDGNGVRVKETTVNSYTSTPGGTAANFGAWSPQFGNNASSSFAINVKDAIVIPAGIKHEDSVDFSGVSYPSSQAAATNFSSRNTDPQFITWKIPLDTSNPVQFLDITVTGTFNEFKVKQFDAGEDNSTFDANSSTNGWLDCMAVNSTQTSGGVPIGGCGNGAFFDGTESNTTLRITAGSGRWGKGSHLYLRIKLIDGQVITKLGIENI
jgi:hypothetical protein